MPDRMQVQQMPEGNLGAVVQDRPLKRCDSLHPFHEALLQHTDIIRHSSGL